jgi:hypothetical protein
VSNLSYIIRSNNFIDREEKKSGYDMMLNKKIFVFVGFLAVFSLMFALPKCSAAEPVDPYVLYDDHGVPTGDLAPWSYTDNWIWWFDGGTGAGTRSLGE